MIKKKFGFSLVELMISLIVISVVTAAFTPILTKKLKTSDQSIGTATAVSITSSAVCNSVSKGCIECENDKCLAVSDGYFLNESTGKSQHCNTTITGCAQCSNSSTCTKSENGYFLNGTGTTKCIAGCSTCTGENICTGCANGYWLNGSSCTACSVQNTACQTCSNGSTCTKCADKYLLSNGKCVACPRHCKTCSSGSVCATCDDGYFKTSNSACFKYNCSGILCYLTYPNGNSDKVLSIYRYDVGDGGIAIPAGINICYAGANCSYSAYSPTCTRTRSEYQYYTSDPLSAASQGASSYNPATRTICNREAAKVARASAAFSGWRLPKEGDLWYISELMTAQSKGTASPPDPFCARSPAGNLPYCYPTHDCIQPNSYDNHRCASWEFLPDDITKYVWPYPGDVSYSGGGNPPHYYGESLHLIFIK